VNVPGKGAPLTDQPKISGKLFSLSLCPNKGICPVTSLVVAAVISPLMYYLNQPSAPLIVAAICVHWHSATEAPSKLPVDCPTNREKQARLSGVQVNSFYL
jgi:hypothetical protein